MITSVEVVYGGYGAARNKIDGIDLCRSCYGNLVTAIRGGTTKLSQAQSPGPMETSDRVSSDVFQKLSG